MSRIRRNSRCHAFTLAELLIALAILGVIAVFTIPKVLVAQQDAKYNAIGKEAAGMLSGAYEAYRLQTSPSSSTRTRDLTPYMNYVSVDTVSMVDSHQAQTDFSCATQVTCLKLHNGATLFYASTAQFGGTATTNAIWYYLDPDGRETDGTTNGPGKSVVFYLYFNGKLRTWGTLEPNTYGNGNPWTADPNRDPPWFSWD